MSCNSNDGDKKSSDQTNVHTDKTTTDKCSFISTVRNNLKAGKENDMYMVLFFAYIYLFSVPYPINFFFILATSVDNNFYICLIEASLVDGVIISLPSCMHPNVAVLYDVGFFRSFPMLMMERMEAPLSTLLSDVGDQVTLRERLM
jgi:hypothetical protein